MSDENDRQGGGVCRPEYTESELEQVERALADFLSPHLNPQIRGADDDDEGIPEMERALDKTRRVLEGCDTESTGVER